MRATDWFYSQSFHHPMAALRDKLEEMADKKEADEMIRLDELQDPARCPSCGSEDVSLLDCAECGECPRCHEAAERGAPYPTLCSHHSEQIASLRSIASSGVDWLRETQRQALKVRR